jgi:hypothetical protein
MTFASPFMGSSLLPALDPEIGIIPSKSPARA